MMNIVAQEVREQMRRMSKTAFPTHPVCKNAVQSCTKSNLARSLSERRRGELNGPGITARDCGGREEQTDGENTARRSRLVLLPYRCGIATHHDNGSAPCDFGSSERRGDRFKLQGVAVGGVAANPERRGFWKIEVTACHVAGSDLDG